MAQRLGICPEGKRQRPWAIRHFVVNMLPASLRADPAALRLVAQVKQQVKCEEVYDYLRQNAALTVAGRPCPGLGLPCTPMHLLRKGCLMVFQEDHPHLTEFIHLNQKSSP
eukprot:EG_transcript_22154